MNQKTFCVSPWTSLHYQFGESLNPCCVMVNRMPITDINQYINSEWLDNIKTSLLSGVQIPECQRCWDQESLNYTSKRLRDNKTYGKIFQLKFQKDLMKRDAAFTEYYVRLGNHCNIRCTTCNDSLSSGWISENKKFNLPYRPLQLIKSDDPIWNHLKLNSKHIGAIEFIGGEPFMMLEKEQVDLLKYLVETGDSKHIRIKYNTNGTRIPKEQLEFWPKFKAVEINVSMDGIEDQFEYLRFPANWVEFNQNIIFYKNLQNSSVPNLELSIITTLSIFTLPYVNSIIEFCNSINIKLFLNMLHSPDLYSFTAAPDGLKNWIIDRIKNINNSTIQNLVSTMHSCKGSTDLIKFKKTIDDLDFKRNTSFSNTFKELDECIQSLI